MRYKKNKPIILRNPSATRPWQHVLEPLSGYLLLGQLLFQDKKEYAKPWNFGPSLSSNITVRELVDIVKNKWKHIEVEFESPKNEETKHLILDSSKAYNKLKWQPVWDIDSTINYTIEWYKNYYEKEIVKTEEQINIFTQDAVKNKNNSKSLYHYTSYINKNFDDKKKILLIEALWEIVLSDGKVHDFESNLLRRLAGLLYISDVNSGNAKKRALDKNQK